MPDPLSHCRQSTLDRARVRGRPRGDRGRFGNRVRNDRGQIVVRRRPATAAGVVAPPLPAPVAVAAAPVAVTPVAAAAAAPVARAGPAVHVNPFLRTTVVAQVGNELTKIFAGLSLELWMGP